MFFPGGAATSQLSGPDDPNYLFYRNERPSAPDGALIDVIHERWKDDFDLLEEHHGYIQWLFPVFENAGMNFESSPLSKSGAALIRADEQCCRRVIKSYRLMLRFYGLSLADERTGALQRDADVAAAQLDNLNTSAHNCARAARLGSLMNACAACLVTRRPSACCRAACLAHHHLAR